MWPFKKTKAVSAEAAFLAHAAAVRAFYRERDTARLQRAARQPATDRQLDAIRQLGRDAARYRWLRDESSLAVDAFGEDLDKLTDAGIASSVLFPAQTDEEKARVVVLGAPTPRPDWVCSECDQNRLKGPCPRRYTTAADTCPMQGPTA